MLKIPGRVSGPCHKPEEGTDESMFWLEMLYESGMMKEEHIRKLYDDGDEILAMTVASIRTVKGKLK